MSRLPLPIERLISFFERLPGIGPKTAARLVFYLLQTPKSYLVDFAGALVDIKEKVVVCPICFNIDDKNPCQICADSSRDRSVVCVVEKALDILAIEKTTKFSGIYHVLGGVINPLEQIGPDQLHIKKLIERIKPGTAIAEVILATNPTMEGEATALYLRREISKTNPQISISRIGHGLPMGADLDYADPGTLMEALKGRQKY
jgi:recombination protein RecR